MNNDDLFLMGWAVCLTAFYVMVLCAVALSEGTL